MNFNYDRNASTSAFKMSKAFSPQSGPGFIMLDEENFPLNNSGIYEQYTQDNVFNNAAIPSGLNINPHKPCSSKTQKRYPFRDNNPSPSPKRTTGKRSHPPGDIIKPVRPLKRRRVDAAQLPPSAGLASSSRPTAHTMPTITALLPIQHDSWYYLPEMWDYCGPDGNPIKSKRWSPNEDGDSNTTPKSNRFREDGDRDNATAITVATWVELNRLRARYIELCQEFHGGPLQVHHLADEASERKMDAMAKASRELQKAMDGVGMASRPQPQFGRSARLVPFSQSTAEPPTLVAKITTPVTISPQHPLLSKGLPEATGSAQPVAYVALSDILPASYSPEPPKKAIPTPVPSFLMTPAQQGPTAAPLDVTSASKDPRRHLRDVPTSDHVAAPVGPPTGPIYFFTTDGQFRFTAAGEAGFKLLIAQGDYNEAFEMLPEDQQFEHLTTPDAISAFRVMHPRKKAEANAVERELWVCKAKVKMERKELPKAVKSDSTEDEFDVIYSDEPCNGVVSTHCSMIRHKKRTHLGRLYQ